MASIGLILSRSTSTTFGIQNALNAFQGSIEPELPSNGKLYTKGCVVNGALDCTAACQVPDEIISNPYTLQNCMVLSALAPDPSIALSAEAVEIANQFAINTTDPGFQSLAFNVYVTIQDCLTGYCSSTPNCQYEDDYYPSYFNETVSQSNVSVNAPFYGDICGYAPQPLNADIGGIGVWLSDCPKELRREPSNCSNRSMFRIGCKLLLLSQYLSCSRRVRSSCM